MSAFVGYPAAPIRSALDRHQVVAQPTQAMASRSGRIHIRMNAANPTSAGSSSSPPTATAAVTPAPALTPSSLSSNRNLILFDAPVSNSGARVRFFVYLAGLESEIDIKKPADLGGLKSEEYLKLNPQGKMPLLVIPGSKIGAPAGSKLSLLPIPESQVILDFLVQMYPKESEFLIPDTLEIRTLNQLATRIHDLYLVPNQASMYRQMSKEERVNGLNAIVKQMDAIELVLSQTVAYMDLKGIHAEPGKVYFGGKSISLADISIFPTFIFLTHILPKVYHWQDMFGGRPVLKKWWLTMNQFDSASKESLPNHHVAMCTERIYQEVDGGLQAWDKDNRWSNLGIQQQVDEDPAAFRLC